MSGEDFKQKTGGTRTVTGRDGTERIEVVNKTNFKGIVSRLKVLARSTQEDKVTLVNGLKELGHVVAATGEGMNDISALRSANVGISVG